MILVRKVHFPPLIDRINCHLLTYCLQVVFSQDGVFVHTAVLTATQGANIIPGIVTIVEKVGEDSLSRSPYYYGTLIYFMETHFKKNLSISRCLMSMFPQLNCLVTSYSISHRVVIVFFCCQPVVSTDFYRVLF